MIRLFVSLDEVALLRQRAEAGDPDPVVVAGLCELAGAHGVSVHLREDRGHIQDRDVRILRQTVRGKLNLEMSAAPSIIERALEIGPDVCTLVPEAAGERTVRGLDLGGRIRDLAHVVRTLRGADIEVSLLIDPDEVSAKACIDLGATQAELCASSYARAKSDSAEARKQLAHLERTGRLVSDGGLRVAVGHGLDYGNVAEVAGLADVQVVGVGHAVIARALVVGMERAIFDMRKAIDEGVRDAHRG